MSAIWEYSQTMAQIENLDGQPYELYMFARKHGIALAAARVIISEHGANRIAADAAATDLISDLTTSRAT